MICAPRTAQRLFLTREQILTVSTESTAAITRIKYKIEKRRLNPSGHGVLGL
jgi:hypothetical protein